MKLIITTGKARKAREQHIVEHAITMAINATSEVLQSYSQHWQDEHLKTAKDRKVLADFMAEAVDVIESARVEAL